MNDDGETFLTTVDRLTREHPGWVERDTGREMRTQDGLLHQLRGAVFGGMNGSGANSAFTSKLTIDATAADLLDEIHRQAVEALASVDPKPTPFGATETYVRLWAGQTTEHKQVTVTGRRERVLKDHEKGLRPVPARVYLERVQMSAGQLVRQWAERIEDYFDPPSTREIQAPCPACNERYIYRMADGVHAPASALNFVRDRATGRTTSARCSACAVSWSPPQFEWLAGAIGAALLPEMMGETE
jgi:hypothetical protein